MILQTGSFQEMCLKVVMLEIKMLNK